MDRLTAADSSNAEWQRDLFLSHMRVGDAQRTQGDLRRAGLLPSGFAVIDRLTKSIPDNAGFQRDLFVSHVMVGIAQRQLGDLPAA